MNHYTIETTQANRYRMKIDAELQNLEAERQALEAVKSFTYSGNVFNKRYETQLHKYLGDTFGRVLLDTSNFRGETEYNRVNAYLSKETYSDKYSLTITFTGYRVGYDYDTKIERIEENRGENYKFYGIASADDVTSEAVARLASIDASVNKLKQARRNIETLIAEHNKLVTTLDTFNDKVPYILADELRIR